MPIWLCADISRRTCTERFRSNVVDVDPGTFNMTKVGFMYPEERAQHSDCPFGDQKSQDVNIPFLVPFEAVRDTAIECEGVCTLETLIETFEQHIENQPEDVSLGNKFMWPHMFLRKIPATYGMPQTVPPQYARRIVIQERRRIGLSAVDSKKLELEFRSMCAYRTARRDGTPLPPDLDNEKIYPLISTHIISAFHDSIVYPPTSKTSGAASVGSEIMGEASCSSETSFPKISLFKIKPNSKTYDVDSFKSLYSKLYKPLPSLNPLVGKEEYKQLNSQIWNEYKVLQISKLAYDKRIEVCKQLNILLNNTNRRYELLLIGSLTAGLAITDLSDMDLCVLGWSRVLVPERYNSLYHLFQIKMLLESVTEIKRVILLEANVPILRFDFLMNGGAVRVDMSCNNIMTALNTKLVATYCQLDWRFQPLHCVIKQWAGRENINDAYKSSLSSYAITLMVIQYLQCGVDPPVLPCLHKELPAISKIDWSTVTKYEQIAQLDWTLDWQSVSDSCLAELLIGFFKFYTNFKYARDVISIREGKPLSRLQLKIKNDALFDLTGFILIEEPFSRMNVAHSVHKDHVFKIIMENILYAGKNLEDELDLNSM